MNKNSNDMEDKIYDIVTDLLRDDITKSEAIDKLLFLCVVGVTLPTNLQEVVEIKNRLLEENPNPYLGENKKDAFEIGIEVCLLDYMLKSNGN